MEPDTIIDTHPLTVPVFQVHIYMDPGRAFSLAFYIKFRLHEVSP